MGNILVFLEQAEGRLRTSALSAITLGRAAQKAQGGKLLLLLHRVVILNDDGGVGGYDESGLLCFGDVGRHYRRIGLVLGVMRRRLTYAEAFYTAAPTAHIRCQRHNFGR